MSSVQVIQTERSRGSGAPVRGFATIAPGEFEPMRDGVRTHSGTRRVHGEMASRNTVGEMLLDPNAE
jgi:hypothetical protein